MLCIRKDELSRSPFEKDKNERIYTIAWNQGPDQIVNIDNVSYIFPSNSILSLMIFQTYSFSRPETIVAWRFNREFYCVVDHDHEVSCVGFLFYGNREVMFVRLNGQNLVAQKLLLDVFKDEFSSSDTIQEDMLRMLLKRLIILVTRLAKEQFIQDPDLTQDKLDLIRNYNLLVERHFRKEHSVAFYAEKLNRSPKTLSNVFGLYNKSTPSRVIRERITTEAKRLLTYSELSIKEIAFELGFQEASHFSNFFKKYTSYSPVHFRQRTKSKK